MADGQSGNRTGRAQTQPLPTDDFRQIASDWITIWQSELSALAADREAQEAWVCWVANWAETFHAMLDLWPSTHDTRTNAPAGPAPALAAFDGRDDAVGRLAERVA